MKFLCVQPGCDAEFESDERPKNCPVCRYPFGGHAADETPWSDYSIKELRAYAASWGVEGWDADTSQAQLIRLLEAAEAE